MPGSFPPPALRKGGHGSHAGLGGNFEQSRRRFVEPLAHFFARFEERDYFLPHRHDAASSWITAPSPLPNFDRKSSEPAQLNAVATSHRADDLIENGIDDILNVALVEVRVLVCDALDEV